MATNAAIHFTSARYGTTTACNRDIRKVACWDDFDAVTCKRCKTVEQERLFMRSMKEQLLGDATTSVDDRPAETDGLEPAGVQLAIVDDSAKRFHCGPAGCPGFPKEHHQLDCPEPRVQLSVDAGHNLSATRGAAYKPTAKLQMLAAAQRQVNELTKLYVQDARAAGLSWADIGEQLGVTKQAAQQRYGRG